MRWRCSSQARAITLALGKGMVQHINLKKTALTYKSSVHRARHLRLCFFTRFHGVAVHQASLTRWKSASVAMARPKSAA
eukprot:2773-Heterococcus_DN1.PRE.1